MIRKLNPDRIMISIAIVELLFRLARFWNPAMYAASGTVVDDAQNAVTDVEMPSLNGIVNHM
jgi:hypothetical protein